MEEHVTRDFKQDVADEEEHGTQAVGRVGQRQVMLHLQLRKADVVPVENGDHITKEQKRDDSQ
jgi:hypothetical protein